MMLHYAKIRPLKEAEMNQGMPAVWEEADQLRELMNEQSDSRLRTRLQMLYLLRCGAVANRIEVAHLLGVGRQTVGRWLRRYEHGGVQALLKRGQASGKVSSLPPEVIAGMRAKLAQPIGVGSFRALQQWVEQTYHFQTTYRVIWHTATDILGARLAVARRTHIKKKAGAEALFRATLEHRLRQAALTVQPVTWDSQLIALATLDQLSWPRQPIHVWTQDESRFGLITIQRRRLTLRGIKPLAPSQHQLESSYLFGIVAPISGDSFFLELPGLDSELFQLFLDHFAHAYSTWLNLVVLDNGPAHIAGTLRIPDHVRFVFTPPYTPEVNPIERLWEDLQARVAGANPASLDALFDLLFDQLRGYTPTELASLTAYPFFKNAANAISSM